MNLKVQRLANLRLVNVFPDIVIDCPKIRNLPKIFLRSFANVAPRHHIQPATGIPSPPRMTFIMHVLLQKFVTYLLQCAKRAHSKLKSWPFLAYSHRVGAKDHLTVDSNTSNEQKQKNQNTSTTSEQTCWINSSRLQQKQEQNLKSSTVEVLISDNLTLRHLNLVAFKIISYLLL